MKLFKSRHFATVFQDLHQSQSICDEAKRRIADGTASSTQYMTTGVERPSEDFIEKIEKQLIAMDDVCKDAGFENASTKITLIVLHLTNFRHEADYSSLAADLRNANDVVMADFWKRKFVEVPAEHNGLVNNDSLFGDEVKKAFPSSGADIKEAGNCIAVGSGTSAVFHLMRAAEWGLRAFCAHLKIIRVRRSRKPKQKKYVPIAYSQWEKMLDALHQKVDAKINSLGPGKRKQDLQEFYYPLLQDLKGFKDAWRNHVMHGRKEYNPAEAKAVLEYVCRFMQLLSTRVSEPRKLEQVDWLADV